MSGARPVATRRVETPLPLDLESCGADGLGEAVWPTPYAKYLALTDALLHEVAALCAAADGDAAVCLQAKASNLHHDLLRLGCLAVDLAGLRRQGRPPAYDPSASALLAYLDGSSDDPSPAARDDWQRPPESGLGGWARQAARATLRNAGTWLLPAPLREDRHGTNALVAAHRRRSRLAVADLHAHQLVGPAAEPPPHWAEEASAAMAEATGRCLAGELDGDAALAARAVRAARHLARTHLGQAAGDLQRLRRWARRPLGRRLIGGTPKYAGRLLGAIYQEAGRDVWRFAHGGDRAFFDDPGWDLSELPFCDRYATHSIGEAEQLAARHAAETGIAFLPQPDDTAALPTERRAGGLNGTLLYVSDGYVGERGHLSPFFRCPDVLYHDWQVRLLGALRRAGWRVLVKPHPKVRASGIDISRHADGVVRGRLDFAADVDCFVFDFAGTAWFDCLFTGRPMVLLDHGYRPRAQVSFADVLAECDVVNCQFDEGNRLTVSPGALAEAIESAKRRNGCGAAFQFRYAPAR